MEAQQDKGQEEESTVASVESGSSPSKCELAWVPVGLLPVFVATTHYGDQLILLGLFGLACLCAGLGVTLRFFLGKGFPKIPECLKNVIAGGGATVLSFLLCMSLPWINPFMEFLSDFMVHAPYGLDVLAIPVIICFFFSMPLLFIMGGCYLGKWVLQGIENCITVGGQWFKKGDWLKRIAGAALLLCVGADVICFIFFVCSLY